MLILTKYLGPTNTKGSRIKACHVSNPKARHVIPYPYEAGSHYDRHQLAAQALARKFHKEVTSCADATPTGYYFVAT